MKRRSLPTKVLALVSVIAMSATCMMGCGSAEETTTDTTGDVTTVAVNEETDEVVEEETNYADTITLVWYPNESADNFITPRQEVANLIQQATGKKVEEKLTTDYAIAIESISSGTAQIGCMFGGEGYVQAKNTSDAVDLLFVNSGESGTLDDAMYYSFLAVNEEDATNYMDGDSYSMQNIEGKKISFVSNSSTSGFKVPTNSILSYFSADSKWADLTVDDLLEGGSDRLFGEVMFGGSHQGSAFNLISGKSDVSAFCDTEIAPYASLVSGEANQVGSVYEIKAEAEAPFDTVAGEKFTVIYSTPVMNGPFVYNSDTLSPEDVEAIRTIFTSDEVADNPIFFYTEGSEEAGMYKKKANERFVLVEDQWYDPIRNMQ